MPSTSGKKKGPLLPAYLIVGANELMRNEAVARMKGRLEPGLDVFNLDERAASADLSAGDIVASLNTVPMGAGPRIVLITEADRLPKPVSEAIIEYLKNPNPGCTLCLVSEKLAKNTRLYKALAKVGPHSVVDCAPKKRWELPKTVLKMGSVHGVQIDQDAAEELISRVGESTTMLDTQVKTLASLCRATGRVTRADVEAHVVRTAEVKPWDFLDAVCDRDAARALGLYQLMQKPSKARQAKLAGKESSALVAAFQRRGPAPCPLRLRGLRTLAQDWRGPRHHLRPSGHGNLRRDIKKKPRSRSCGARAYQDQTTRATPSS